MTYLAFTLVAVLVGLLFASIGVVFALLRRLDRANQAVLDQASSMLSMATQQANQAPYQMERMMESLADSTARIHATINETVKTVLVPPPVQFMDGPAIPYPMPTMNEGLESEPWDHTDRLDPGIQDTGPRAYMGYGFETEPGFDEDNPFGIPGLHAPWAAPKATA
jgi:hypothetical protein